MALGIGIDLIEIERVERALERRPRLAERLFTEAELSYARERARPGRHLAARFAAKEAVIKALGQGVPPREIEVISGGPSAREAARRGGGCGRRHRDRDLSDALARQRRRRGHRGIRTPPSSAAANSRG